MTRKNRSRGFSLIELMAVITISAALLTIVTAWLHQVMTFSSSINKKQCHHQTLLRLETDFRSDIHDAILVEKSNSEVDQIMSLHMADESIVRYEIGPNQHVITRRFYEPEAKEPSGFEYFKLSDMSESNWSFDEFPDWASLTVTRKQFADLPKGDGQKKQMTQYVSMEELPIDLHVRARVNRWQLKMAEELNSPRGGEQ